ncbi:MAG: ABC transporter ATP-binding protein [Bacteroidota bacterium]
MKTYLRIIRYAAPLGSLLPQYLVFAFLGVVFGLTNFILLQPLFDVIFEQLGPEELQKYVALPPFELSVEYVKDLFYHYLIEFEKEYGKFGTLGYVCVVIVLSVFLANLFRYASEVILSILKARIVKNLRNDVFDRISRLHIGYFTQERKGDILSRLTNDVQEVEVSVASSLKVIFKEPVTVIIYFVTLFYMSTQLTLFTVIVLPVLGGIISEIVRRLKKSATESQESLSRLVTLIDETLSGIRIIKAFNAREYVANKFSKENDFYAKVNVSMARRREAASPMSQLLGVLIVAVILMYGGNLVLNNESSLDASGFFTYLIIYSQILPPFKEISRAISSVQRGLVSGQRVFDIVDAERTIKNSPNATEVKSFEKGIHFNKVSFAYEDVDVLKNIDLKVEKGKMVALVGPSGGGKSTLADLIPRFYDPTEGDILLEGKPLRDLDIESLRSLMGIVTQESILFNDTIFNNIAFGKPNANQNDVEEAAKIANAHDFILQTENGYETNIGDRGAKLSGGQRQRISIARAILKNPPILILDEATSALDSESEKLVQEALTNLMKNRTSVVIAHRLSTIQHADEIVVIQKGKIIERGGHIDLIEKNGMYKKLNEMQAL